MKKQKSHVEEINKSFDSFYSNKSQPPVLVFGNLPNDIIHQCKRIQIINKKIDNMIKEKIKQEKQEQEKEKQEKQEKEEKKEDKKKEENKINLI